MSTIYVLVVTLFLQGGLVGAKAITAPSQADCEAARPLITQEMLSKPVQVGDKKLLVLDAQAKCISFTQGNNA